MPRKTTTEKRTFRTLEQKLAALADFDARATTGESLNDVAARHGVHPSMLHYWSTARKKGSLDAPFAKAPKKPGSERRSFSDEFKQEAVRRFHSRGTMQVKVLCEELGIATKQLRDWVRAGVPPADVPRSNGHDIVRAKVHAPALPRQQVLNLDDASSAVLAQMRVAQLEHNNGTLKRIVQLMLEQL